MITAIAGKPGAGKTSLMTAIMLYNYMNKRLQALRDCKKYIDEFNETRENKLNKPEDMPQFANYEVKFHIGYEKYYKPYWINDYRFGLPGGRNNKYIVQFIPPGSIIYLTEIERILDNRQTATLPQWVSRAFQIHRQYHLEIYLDTQRAFGIDPKIREIAGQFLHVLDQKHDEDKLGNIIHTTWTCYLFERISDYEEYLNKGNMHGAEKIQYDFNGNIFDVYNSFALGAEFLPPDNKSAKFNMLEFLSSEQIKELKTSKPEEFIFYDSLEPEGYRKDFKVVKK